MGSANLPLNIYTDLCGRHRDTYSCYSWSYCLWALPAHAWSLLLPWSSVSLSPDSSHCLNCSFTVGYFSLVPVGMYREGRMFFPTSNTEVENRRAPRLDSWYLSSGVKLKLCSHSDSPRTKLVAEAELWWSKEIRWPLLRSRKTSLSAYAQGDFLGVKNGEDITP